MIDFPASPTVGQQFTAAGVTWLWDSVKWTLLGIAGGSSVIVSDTPPANPVNGQQWWDSVGGQLYVWYNDGNSSQWVISINVASALPPATTTALGGVKVDGSTIVAAADGTISTPGGPFLPLAGGVLTGGLTPASAGIVGVASGNNAPAGAIGEVLSSVSSVGTFGTSGSPVNITQISPTPGDWDVTGEVWITATSTTTQIGGWIGNTTSPPSAPALNNTLHQVVGGFGAGLQTLPLRMIRVTIPFAATPWSVYCGATFTGTAPTYQGLIWARRAR